MVPIEVHLLDQPPGPEGLPLIFVDTHPDFPAHGKGDPAKRQRGDIPRLLEVHDIMLGFGISNDCSDLKAMDAMITILYNYNPALLHQFLDYDDIGVGFRCYSHNQERYDIEIKTLGFGWTIRLWDKYLDADGRTCSIEQREQPFLEVKYTWLDGNKLDGPHGVPTKQWTFEGVRGTYISPGASEIIREGEVAEAYAKRVARYMMLLRPWEMRSGVEFKITRIPNKKEFRASIWEILDTPPVDMCGVPAFRINHTYSLLCPKIKE